MVYRRRTAYELGFSGGQVDTTSPSLLKPTESVSHRNLFPFEGKAVTRPAIRIVNSGGLGGLDTANYKLRSVLMHVDPETGARTLIGGCYAGFVFLNKTLGTFQLLPVLSGLILGSYRPWFRCQTLGVQYWVREDSGGILRATPGSVGRAGIVAPSTAPTLADGGAGGVMDAGEYKVVVRFKNSRTGAISDYSPESNAITIVANNKLTVTNIATSSNGQVDSREIGLTLANRPGTFYYGATLADNLSSGPVTLNLTPASVGDPFEQRNGPPPGNAKAVAWWDAAQALVTTDGKSLFVSETALPESFSADGDLVFDFGRDDGFPIVGLLPVGQRCLVGKPNRVDFLSGLSRDEYRKDMLTDHYGVASGLSMRAVGGTAFWLAVAKTGLCVVRADGSQIQTVSDDKVDAVLAQVPESAVPSAEGWIWPLYNLYCLSLSLGQVTDESRYVQEITLAYDYKQSRWFTLDFDPRFLGYPHISSFPQQTLAPLSYCDWYAGEGTDVTPYLIFDYSRDTSDADVQPTKPWEFVYAWDLETGLDPGGPVDWHVKTRALPAAPGMRHKPDKLTLKADSRSGVRRVTFAAYKGTDRETPAYSKDFDLPGDEGEVERTLPVASRENSLLAASYLIKLSGEGLIELHDGSQIEMAEASIRDRILPVAE